ncbi:MAG: TadE family type IV pilus minor pilin [Arthrobacter sp.]|uniref:TadE family type IV pilus minor pilin n=1 Tax=Arthrobacter sp. TaxID=1667 RepID=UPI003469E9D0
MFRAGIRPPAEPGRGPRGSSTAEFAVLLPALAGLLAVALCAGAVGSTQIRLEQAARAAARELARGESAATAAETARRLAGVGVGIEIGGRSGYRSVRLTTGSALPDLGRGTPLAGLIVLSAEAEARSEVDHGGGGTLGP